MRLTLSCFVIKPKSMQYYRFPDHQVVLQQFYSYRQIRHVAAQILSETELEQTQPNPLGFDTIRAPDIYEILSKHNIKKSDTPGHSEDSGDEGNSPASVGSPEDSLPCRRTNYLKTLSIIINNKEEIIAQQDKLNPLLGPETQNEEEKSLQGAD